MKVISVKHNADILVNTYQIHESVKNEVVSKLREGVPAIGKDSSNVKATVHTIWDWEPNNIIFKNLKEHISQEIDRHYKPGFIEENERRPLHCSNFWLNVYEKADYAQRHHQVPFAYSFVYFVEFLGSDLMIYSSVGGLEFSCKLSSKINLSAGDNFKFDISPSVLHIFDNTSGQRA